MVPCPEWSRCASRSITGIPAMPSGRSLPQYAGRELPVSYVEKTANAARWGYCPVGCVSGMRARGESGQQHLQRNTERHRPTARHTSEYSDPIFQRAECRTAVQALFSRNLETQQTPHASIDQSGLHPFRSRRNATHGRSSDYANPSGQAKKSAISLRPKTIFSLSCRITTNLKNMNPFQPASKRRTFRKIYWSVLALLGWALTACLDPSGLTITVDTDQIDMGRSVRVQAKYTPVAGDTTRVMLMPYVNGKRWGAHEFPDSTGQALVPVAAAQSGTCTDRRCRRPLRHHPVVRI